jgi:hypothetical protein
MFCKQCGKEIDSDSKFCVHCGSAQITGLSVVGNEPTITRNEHVVNPLTVKKLESVFGIQLSKQVIGGYLVWFLIHLIILLTQWNAAYHQNRYFWPYDTKSELEDYDFTEFLLYTLVPLVILVIINLLKKPKATK